MQKMTDTDDTGMTDLASGLIESIAPEDVERGSGVALWKQIAERIEADINAGTLRPGARLPTEMELAERFKVNRHTLRRALAMLTDQGLIEATPGRGTEIGRASCRERVCSVV